VRVLLEADVALAPLTTLKLGGRARHFVLAQNEDDLAEALAWASREGLPTFVLGGGSNVVIPDVGVDGLVVALGMLGTRCERTPEHCLVAVAAGESWDGLVSWSVQEGLAGLECLSGIPGLVGATPIQNVGAYGQEVSETIQRVRAFDREERRFVTLDGSACEFGYRDSRFKGRDKDRFVVTEVTFALRPDGQPALAYPELKRALGGASATLAEVRDKVLALRRAKSMVLSEGDENARSCGSFFVNPVVEAATADLAQAGLGRPDMPRFPQADGRVKLSAAFLIENSGFTKGLRRGNVGISSRHALALVCHAGASAAELMTFAAEVQAGVQERTSVRLTPEPALW
jgi:UDP-N-acetylmuramate dehydrogenase